MKVIHISSSSADPQTMNGVNKTIFYLLASQALEGMDCELWTLSSVPEKVKDKPYPIRGFPTESLSFALPASLRIAIRALPKDSLVHFHSAFVLAFAPIARLLYKAGIPWVVTPQGAYMPRSIAHRKHWLKRLYLWLFDDFLLIHAYALHAVGRKEMPVLIRKNPRSFYIPNGIPQISTIAEPLQKHASLSFVYCGRLHIAQKGLDLLLAGFAQFLQSKAEADLHLIGDGPDRKRLEDLALSLGIIEHLRFHGAQFAEAKDTLIRQGHVFVHSSHWEGLPFSVLEAAALGLALLVSEETNLGEEVRNYKAGYVLPELSADAIAAAMSQMHEAFQQHSLVTYGDNAREMVKQAFRIEEMARQISVKLYPPQKVSEAP